MTIQIIKNSIERLSSSLKNIEKEDTNKIKNTNNFYDFKERKISYYLNSIQNNFNNIKENIPKLKDYSKYDRNNERYFAKSTNLIGDLDELYKNKKFQQMRVYLQELYETINMFNVPRINIVFKKPKNIPEDIREEVMADLNEIENCFKFGCYRSATIICGRVLETVLHRKYYELTNNDLLEKAPGIGLGKVVAKLTEENIIFDPGITQQIHLINQTRIFSVHKKKEVFSPSETQTQAIILYTIDIIEKLFR